MIAVCSTSQAVSPGQGMYDLARELYPLCRSLTGSGVRQTLARLGELLPLEMHEVPSGTPIFDWKVPREWNIRDAYIKDDSGRRLVDFHENNLHVVGYSVPMHRKLRWSQLKSHLHYLVDRPSWIPYRNSFHAEQWGFCISYRQFEQLEAQGERSYEVCIDSTLAAGSLTYGEVYLPGDTDEEVLISTHICHPSLANDNLSGIAVATFLAQELQQRTTRYSYRFLFAPATIGAIAWLTINQHQLNRVKHGWILTGVGDAGAPTYKRSRRGDAEIDRAFAHVLGSCNQPSTILDFEPFGYDERQFCSPGINLPIGCLMRTPNQQYAEYHTSADNLDFISAESLADSLSICMQVVEVLDSNRNYKNRLPYGEPCLGPRGLYRAFGTGAQPRDIQKAVMWVLNLCDGHHSLLDIAERSKLPFALLQQAAVLLEQHEILAVVDPPLSSHGTERT